MKSLLSGFFAMFLTIAASADTVTFDCGQDRNIKQSLVVRSAKEGSHYPLAATLVIAGKDSTTGTLVSRRISMVGSIETSDELSRTPQPLIVLLDAQDPRNQLYVQNKRLVGEKARAKFSQIRPDGNGNPVSIDKKLNCSVVSAR
jgi:hypothetical protein